MIIGTDVIPESWSNGNSIPIYKSKGKVYDHYRPITIIRCLGKLFTAILDNKLQNASENLNIISEN